MVINILKYLMYVAILTDCCNGVLTYFPARVR